VSRSDSRCHLRHEEINYAKSATSSAETKRKGITNVFARTFRMRITLYMHECKNNRYRSGKLLIRQWQARPACVIITIYFCRMFIHDYIVKIWSTFVWRPIRAVQFAGWIHAWIRQLRTLMRPSPTKHVNNDNYDARIDRKSRACSNGRSRAPAPTTRVTAPLGFGGRRSISRRQCMTFSRRISRVHLCISYANPWWHKGRKINARVGKRAEINSISN